MNTQVKDFIKITDIPVPSAVLENCKQLENQMTKSLTGNGFSDYRDCSEYYLHPQAYEHFSPVEKELYDFFDSFLTTAINNYVDEFKIDKSTIVNAHAGFHILKYEDNGRYKEHVDDFGRKAFRRLSVSLQLNDNFEGGEFSFFNGTHTVKLKANQSIIFPSLWMYPHQVLPVTSGTRWSVVSWVI